MEYKEDTICSSNRFNPPPAYSTIRTTSPCVFFHSTIPYLIQHLTLFRLDFCWSYLSLIYLGQHSLICLHLISWNQFPYDGGPPYRNDTLWTLNLVSIDNTWLSSHTSLFSTGENLSTIISKVRDPPPTI